MVAGNRSCIDTLPNELLSDVLSSLPTKALLPPSSTSRRFHSAINSLLKLRLLRAAALSNRGLILECYHPTAKLSTPYLECEVTGNAWEELTEASDVRTLATHYTHFRPTLQEENMRPRRRYPRVNSLVLNLNKHEAEPPTVDVTLDSCELFTQLCAVTNVVTVGPRRGLFTGHVNVGDGVVRVWRGWLAERAGKEPGTEEDDILWADGRQDVGVRFRVLEKYEPVMQQPILLGRDEEPVVSYTLVYEELLVRTSKLLLSLEKAEDEDCRQSGKAIVIASLAPN